MSKQCLDDAVEMAQILDTILSGGLLDVVDRDIFDVLTTADNFTAFSAVGGETTADGVTRIAAQLAQNGRQNISVCLNPSDFLGMQLHKASGSGIYLGTPATLASRVVACPAVTSGKLLAFAGAGAQWADREAVNVTAGMVDDSFVRNIVVLLAECRGAVLVRDPGLIAYGNATA